MIERCTSIKHRDWLRLRSELWPHCSEKEHLAEMVDICSNPGRLGAFVAYDHAARPVGFAEAAARTDYVNGTNHEQRMHSWAQMPGNLERLA